MTTKRKSRKTDRGVRTSVKAVRKNISSQNMVVHKSGLAVKHIGNKKRSSGKRA